uniref:RIMS-binding protein 2 n=1 Tax=Phasianus colchicus TaxID=9054 RepID=A0A669PCW4_PHACC
GEQGQRQSSHCNMVLQHKPTAIQDRCQVSNGKGRACKEQRECKVAEGPWAGLGKGSCFPETEEKVKHLKRKNAELAVIAKRLEERARKLQEANLKVVTAPVPLKGSSLELCKKAFARQRAKDLTEQASALLAKDKQIEALQQECRELQAKLIAGKGDPRCPNVVEFDRLLRESQKEVLRLQRQIALKNFKECLRSSKGGSGGSLPSAAVRPGPWSIFACSMQEFELKKKRKKCENLEHEVRKKHKRCKELVILSLQVESENADLKLQVVLVTKERDSVIQRNQGLQTKLENLEQVLKHMRDVAERRQLLEAEHKEALLVLQEKQEEVRRLQQAQAEAKREHEGAVQLLEARVKDLEDQCRSQTEQFSLLSQELKQFRLQTGKIDLLTSTLVTSELPLALCSSTPQPHWEKGNCWRCLRSSQRVPEAVVGSPVSVASSQKQAKKVESQSSSSKSESMQNSSKSCPTPEVDTASEMEELDVDSISLMPEPGSQGPAKLQVFLARYSYNPFDGPNENPEAELPLTAGEYIYIYGDMDEDGFFEGELMDGRRGLVPSNFVERVSDDDLMTVLPSELNDLTHSSYQEKSFVSASTSSGDKSDFSIEESSISPLVSRAEGDQEERVSHTAVPYPRKLTLIKQLARSIVVGWEPPLLPAGCPDIQSYNIYVDEELRQNVKSGFQTKAVIEKLDLKTKAYRVSVQSVTEKGSSDKLRCTFFVGQDLCVAPTMLKVRNVTATSAEVSWLPCNSNYNHAVYLNGEECDITKPGVYWYTFCNLQPNTQYVAKLEARPLKTLWEEVSEGQEQNSAVIHFTTPLAGTPDAPLDVQVEVGPSPGILVISWLPVTIDAEGSSNGVRVTGYAVYADGQKAIEVTSPTAGSVLVDLSQLQMFQVCREVSVRTMSLYGESVDSVPAQISSVLLRASHHSSPSDSAVSTTITSRLPCGESRGSLPARSPPTHEAAVLLLQQKAPTDSSDAKLTDLSSSHDGSAQSLPEKASSLLQLSLHRGSVGHTSGTSLQGSDAAQDKKCLTVPPQQADSTELPGEGTEPISSREAELKSLGEGTEVLVSHNRSSDLSDILEEEEEDELSSEALDEKKWDPREPCYRENGEKMDLCDTDSDEEILERILELPLQKNHSKKLFSIPEVTEDEDEDEDEDEKCVTEEKENPQGSLEAPTYIAGRSEKPLSTQDPFPKADGSDSSPDLSVQTPRDEQTAKESRGSADHMSPSWSQKRIRGQPEMGRKRQNDSTEHCSRLLGNCSQMGGGLYRAPSLREELNIVSSSAGKEGFDAYTRARQSASRRIYGKTVVSGFAEPAGMAAHCSSSRSLEIDIEYDSEDDQDSTCSSPPESRLWPERAQNYPRGQELPGSAAWQTPSRRGSRSLRRCQMQKPLLSSPGEWRKREELGSKRERGCWKLHRGTAGISTSETTAEDDGIRIFVALFDYDPVSMSPNPDAAEEELPFKEGQILKVCGDKDADGFYRGECAGREGYIPCNMVSEVQVENNEIKMQLLKQGFLPADPPMDSIGQKHQDFEAELLTPRSMVAVFDYNPKESSPNADAEAELTFSAGDIITVFGSMDDDGFYYQRCRGGFVSPNYLLMNWRQFFRMTVELGL